MKKRHSQMWAASLAFVALLMCSCSHKGASEKEMDSFISNLMSRMTLEEKLGQMNLPSVPNTSVVTGNQKCENVNTSDRKMCYYNKYSNRIKKDCRRKLEYENRISGRKNNRR